MTPCIYSQIRTRRAAKVILKFALKICQANYHQTILQDQTKKQKLMCIFPCFHDKLNHIQGRKWLSTSGGASSSIAAMAARRRCRRRLLFCQKVGGQLPPLPPLQLHPCLLKK